MDKTVLTARPDFFQADQGLLFLTNESERLNRMNITAEILYDILLKQYPLSRYGRGFKERNLCLPVFYRSMEDLQDGHVYVANSRDFPATSDKDCLFICIGECRSRIWESWPGRVFYISGENLDLLSVFNSVQMIFEKLSRWYFEMQALIDGRADIEEMLRISVPIFENQIIITDSDFQILAFCDTSNSQGQKEIQICKEVTRVPEEAGIYLEEDHSHNSQYRSPFFFQGQVGEEERNDYCINL